MYVHFESHPAADYFERRDRPCPRDLKMARYGATYRLAHINMCLDQRSVYRAAGPRPDGAAAEIFYEVEDLEDLERRLSEDPYVIGGVWTAWSARPLSFFIAPTMLVPPRLDGSREVAVVEARTSDPAATRAALLELQAEDRLALAGVTPEGVLVAWLKSTDRTAAENLLQQRVPLLSAVKSAHSIFWVL